MPEQNERPLLLQVGPLLPALQDALNSRHEVCSALEAPDQAALLGRAWAGRGVAQVTSGVHGATRELMSALPGLQAVFSFGVGYDSIDIAAARDLGVVVSNTPGVLDDCDADTAFALLIDVARGISAADRFRAPRRLAQGKFPLTSRLAGKTCGNRRPGQHRQEHRPRAEAFAWRWPITDANRSRERPYRYHAELEDLAEAADFLVLSLPGGPATTSWSTPGSSPPWDRTAISSISPAASVVDEPALVAALQAGSLGGAGLDVFAEEPEVPAALLALDNVVLTPHLGSGTHETRQAMADLVLANVERYFAEGRLGHAGLTDANRGYSMAGRVFRGCGAPGVVDLAAAFGPEAVGIVLGFEGDGEFALALLQHEVVVGIEEGQADGEGLGRAGEVIDDHREVIAGIDLQFAHDIAIHALFQAQPGIHLIGRGEAR